MTWILPFFLLPPRTIIASEQSRDLIQSEHLSVFALPFLSSFLGSGVPKVTINKVASRPNKKPSGSPSPLLSLFPMNRSRIPPDLPSAFSPSLSLFLSIENHITESPAKENTEQRSVEFPILLLPPFSFPPEATIRRDRKLSTSGFQLVVKPVTDCDSFLLFFLFFFFQMTKWKILIGQDRCY